MENTLELQLVCEGEKHDDNSHQDHSHFYLTFCKHFNIFIVFCGAEEEKFTFFVAHILLSFSDPFI